MTDTLQSNPLPPYCGSFPGLIAGTTTTITTTGAIDYAINGLGYRKATITNGATPTTDYVTGAAFPGILRNKGAVILIGLNAAGDVKAVQGPIVGLDTAGSFIKAPQFGPVPDNFCPIGYLVIKAGSTADNTTGFVFGTSNNSSVTGITYSFQSLMGGVPARPKVS